MALEQELERQGNWLFKYRGILPVIIIVAGAAVFINMKLNPKTFFLENTPYETYYQIGCLMVSLIGLFIRIYTVGHTPAYTSGRNTKNQMADSLNTTGIYSIVRHPLYFGNFFMWLGVCLLTGNLWFIIIFCLIYWIYYERIMFAEEQFLYRKFGAVYTQWANATPAFFPNFKLFVKPDLPFSWKKVLKKEKNGILALFLLFSSLDILGDWVQKNNNYNLFLLVACIISIVLYGILEFLKKKTQVLNEQNR